MPLRSPYRLTEMTAAATGWVAVQYQDPGAGPVNLRKAGVLLWAVAELLDQEERQVLERRIVGIVQTSDGDLQPAETQDAFLGYLEPGGDENARYRERAQYQVDLLRSRRPPHPGGQP